MAVDLWNKCDGIKHIQSLNEIAWRIIEAQETTATRKLVDSLEEQIILEEMLEDNKPPLSKEMLKFHPLLYTPFRYPPLKHGSRFGNKSESSLWYGSLTLKTAMAEKAFYQFNFIRASDADYGMITVPLTAFSARVKTEKGINMTASPFSKYTSTLSSPDSYVASQGIGAAMRNAKIQAFTYHSARDISHGINIALFSIHAFSQKHPDARSFQSWQSTLNNNVIEFTRSSAITSDTISYSIDEFMVNGQLPFPAN